MSSVSTMQGQAPVRGLGRHEMAWIFLKAITAPPMIPTFTRRSRLLPTPQLRTYSKFPCSSCAKAHRKAATMDTILWNSAVLTGARSEHRSLMSRWRSGFIPALSPGIEFRVSAVPTRVPVDYFVEDHDMTRDATPVIVVSPAIDCHSVRYPAWRSSTQRVCSLLYAPCRLYLHSVPMERQARHR
jgi:hypothetical protein